MMSLGRPRTLRERHTHQYDGIENQFELAGNGCHFQASNPKDFIDLPVLLYNAKV